MTLISIKLKQNEDGATAYILLLTFEF